MTGYVPAGRSGGGVTINTLGGPNMATERKTFDIGRNAKSGQFTTVKEAERKSASHIVERMPKKGYGDS